MAGSITGSGENLLQVARRLKDGGQQTVDGLSDVTRKAEDASDDLHNLEKQAKEAVEALRSLMGLADGAVDSFDRLGKSTGAPGKGAVQLKKACGELQLGDQDLAKVFVPQIEPLADEVARTIEQFKEYASTFAKAVEDIQEGTRAVMQNAAKLNEGAARIRRGVIGLSEDLGTTRTQLGQRIPEAAHRVEARGHEVINTTRR